MKLDCLVIAAHPDDAEISVGGTLLKLAAAGKKTGIIDVTRGEMGTRGTATDRATESAKASELLGLSFRHNLDAGDGRIVVTPELRERTASQLRHTIEKVAEKAARVEANRSGSGRRHERRCNHALFPRGGAQERSLGPLPYMARFGTDWIDDLLRDLDPFAPEHVHCALSEHTRPLPS